MARAFASQADLAEKKITFSRLSEHAYGFTAASVCVALGNYHNCGPDDQIAAEFVAIQDVAGMSRLCAAAASLGELPDPAATMRTRMEERMREYERYF